MKGTVIASVMDFVHTYMNNFPILNWLQGHIIINNAFMNWGRYVASTETVDQLTFTSDYLFLGKWPDKKVASVITLGTIPSRKGVTKERNIIDVLAHEWVCRMNVYYDQVRTEKVERFKTVINHSKTDVENITDCLLDIVKPLQLDEALDFFAVLAVEWARRGYVEEGFHPEKKGYPFTKEAKKEDIDEWVTKFELWSFMEGFQVWL